MRRSYGPGKLMLRRADSKTIHTLYTSDDGWYVETVRMVLSPDGSHLMRYMN